MTYTLVADGRSDAVLLPIITWCLKQHKVNSVVEQWADFTRIPRPRNTEERLRTALDLYPCDALFVHRYAEGQSSKKRREEIAHALRDISIRHIPVVPIRMTEAWLLADEIAIRSAAGNPNGRESLNLPEVRRLEDLTDPKKTLYDALTKASGRNTRRQARFRVRQRVHNIPMYIDDYSNLNVLSAFQVLQRDIRALIKNNFSLTVKQEIRSV